MEKEHHLVLTTYKDKQETSDHDKQNPRIVNVKFCNIETAINKLDRFKLYSKIYITSNSVLIQKPITKIFNNDILILYYKWCYINCADVVAKSIQKKITAVVSDRSNYAILNLPFM